MATTVLVVVDAAATAAVWVVVFALAGRWAPVVVLALVTGGAVLALSDRATAIWVRGRRGARPLSAEESQELAGAITWLSRARLGPPAIHLFVARGELASAATWARPVGRRAVLVSPGLVRAAAALLPADQVAAALAHAAVQTRRRGARLAPAWDLWSLPWQFLRATATAIGRTLRRQPLLRFGWSGRWIVGTVALVQSAQEGHPVIGALAATFVALTYVLPRARKAHTEHVNIRADRGVAAAGLGTPWADLLARTPGPGHVERANRLRPPQTTSARARPVLGVVRDLPE